MKSAIASAFHFFGALTGWSVARAKKQQVGRILMFHGVGDDAYPEGEFEAHLQFLRNHFSIVPLQLLAEKINAKEQITDEVVLTFDDGLRNNVSAAYPVLKRLNLPATFFVCPGLIENQRWLWNHEARARLHTLTAAHRGKLDAESDGEVEKIVSWMKTLPLKKREEIENQIREMSAAFSPSPEQRKKYDVMTWDELRSLDSNLITIGSHTVNHPILSTLDSAELRFEIFQSRRMLEEKLGKTVDQFCYPNGAHNPSVMEEVRKSYRIAVTTEADFVSNSSDVIRLPRIGIVEQPLLSWRMHRPGA